MGALADSLLANPVYYIEAALALAAAIGFVWFLRGFFSGIWHVILIDGHDEHMGHYRDRVTWGFLFLLYLFIIWEILRWIGGFFIFTP